MQQPEPQLLLGCRIDAQRHNFSSQRENSPKRLAKPQLVATTKTLFQHTLGWSTQQPVHVPLVVGTSQASPHGRKANG